MKELKFNVGDYVKIIGGFAGKVGFVGKVVGADATLYHPYDVLLPGYPEPFILAEDEMEIVSGGESGDK